MDYKELVKGINVHEIGNPIDSFPKKRARAKTKTVEIDVHQTRTEHTSGRERKVLFIAECKFRGKGKLGTKGEVKFFMYKAKDLLKQQKGMSKRFPETWSPRIGDIWFVSINGFRKSALAETFQVDGCTIKLIDGNELNERLAGQNMTRIPII